MGKRARIRDRNVPGRGACEPRRLGIRPCRVTSFAKVACQASWSTSSRWKIGASSGARLVLPSRSTRLVASTSRS
jgi:hypothetical protein